MKTFGYTFRDNAGALKQGTLQAVDRPDALRQIKAKGCVPVSVSEGKAAASGARATMSFGGHGRALWMAAAGTLLIAVLVVWRSQDRKPAERQASAPAAAKKAVRPPRPAPPETTPAAAVQEVPAEVQPAPAAAAGTPPRAERTPEVADASDKRPVPAPAPEPEMEAPKAPERPNPYKSNTEQLLGMAMSVPPGVPIPPLPIPKNLDADFVKSLSNEIVIYDDDDERTAQIKENVAVAKNQLLKMVEEGRSVSEVLQEFQDKTNERIAVRREAQLELNNLYQNGSQKEAREYMEKINKAFIDLGVDPISMPLPRKAP